MEGLFGIGEASDVVGVVIVLHRVRSNGVLLRRAARKRLLEEHGLFADVREFGGAHGLVSGRVQQVRSVAETLISVALVGPSGGLCNRLISAVQILIESVLLKAVVTRKDGLHLVSDRHGVEFDLTAELAPVSVDGAIPLAVDRLALLLLPQVLLDLILGEHVVSLEMIGLERRLPVTELVSDGGLWIVVHDRHVGFFPLGIEATSSECAQGHYFIAALGNFMLGKAPFEVQRVLSLVVEELLNDPVLQGLGHSGHALLESLLVLSFLTRSDAFLFEWAVEEIVFPRDLHPDARTKRALLGLYVTLLSYWEISLEVIGFDSQELVLLDVRFPEVEDDLLR